MNELRETLYDFLSTDVGLAITVAVGGRYYAEIAPENATFPYVVFNIIDDVPETVWKSGAKRIHNVRVQFTIWDDDQYDGTPVSVIQGKLRAALDYAAVPSVDSAYELVGIWPDVATGPDPVDGRMRATQDYMIRMERLT